METPFINKQYPGDPRLTEFKPGCVIKGLEWASVLQFYARLKRELREAVYSSDASPECKRVVWQALARLLEEKAAELEELAASSK